jgi:hypothetical protein
MKLNKLAASIGIFLSLDAAGLVVALAEYAPRGTGPSGRCLRSVPGTARQCPC